MARYPLRFFPVILLVVLCSLPMLQGTVTAALATDALPDDMQDLQIQKQYVPSSFKRAGTIHSLDGDVVVVHRSTQEAYQGTEGDPIHENDEFYTLPDSRCRLRFTNEDVVSLAPETRFSVDEYASDEEKAEKTSFFGMVKGKAMFYAMRLFGTKKKNFHVKTPTAVMGVRGTKFGAHVYWVEEKTAQGRGVQVADSGRGMGPLLAQAGGNLTPVLVVGCGDGSVGVNGVILSPGEYYNSFTNTTGYDPSVLGNIERSTGGAGGDGGEVGGGGDTGGGGGDDGSLTNVLTTIVQTQGVDGAQGGEEEPVTLTMYGYFTSLLKSDYEGMFYLEDVFITKTSSPFGPGIEHKLESIIDSDYLIWEDGYTEVTVGGASYDPKTTITEHPKSSDYDYLAYGQWEHSGSFTGTDTHQFVNHGWWLNGYAPPADIIAQQKGSIPYSGDAYGTLYHEQTDACDLSGSFSATANFDTGSIQNFSLAVTDGGTRGATISGGGGSIQSDGTFKIIGGQWHLIHDEISYDPSHKGAHGRFFGPNAEEIGGDWGMSYGSLIGASGVWAGKKSP